VGLVVRRLGATLITNGLGCVSADTPWENRRGPYTAAVTSSTELNAAATSNTELNAAATSSTILNAEVTNG